MGVEYAISLCGMYVLNEKDIFSGILRVILDLILTVISMKEWICLMVIESYVNLLQSNTSFVI